MPEEYPNKCTRCGFCCLIERCPMAILTWEVKHKGLDVTCPGLSFENGVASCSIISTKEETHYIMGVGVGCCILTTILTNNGLINFADLPSEIKKKIVEDTRKQLVTVVHRN